ncbi:unnamed protein product [Prorocentrum cordatum]|uniref:Uncharacterized protein n=1 Tax=Prorocentrum cordatum TaxID=2364126 RepID=A0ABN9XXP1_9DINO|nr:unnamed protein product [Polarella glacialis]
MPKGRLQPFSLVFHPNGKDEDDGPYRSRALPPTAAPVDVENSNFAGRMLLLHDTGNEPEPTNVEPALRKGLVLRIQGKFRKPTTVGDLRASLGSVQAKASVVLERWHSRSTAVAVQKFGPGAASHLSRRKIWFLDEHGAVCFGPLMLQTWFQVYTCMF